MQHLTWPIGSHAAWVSGWDCHTIRHDGGPGPGLPGEERHLQPHDMHACACNTHVCAHCVDKRHLIYDALPSRCWEHYHNTSSTQLSCGKLTVSGLRNHTKGLASCSSSMTFNGEHTYLFVTSTWAKAAQHSERLRMDYMNACLQGTSRSRQTLLDSLLKLSHRCDITGAGPCPHSARSASAGSWARTAAPLGYAASPGQGL